MPDEAVPEAELEVIRLLADGWDDRAIARHLRLSQVTIRRRIHSFRGRMNARTRIQAVAIAARRGLI